MSDMTVNDYSSAQPITPRKGASFGTIMLISGIVAIVAVIGFALLHRNNEGKLLNDPAPDFALTTFDGDEISLSDYRGNVVVVNFWAQWCAPCRQEAPDLERTWRAYQDQGVMFIGVAWADNGPRTMQYIEDYDLTFMNGPDLGTRIAAQYDVGAVPETFIVNPEGIVTHEIRMPITAQQLANAIEESRLSVGGQS